MKKTLILGCMLLLAISCKAQIIVPVEKTIDYRTAGDGIPDDTYLKDVNNLFGKYVGSWRGTYGGKVYIVYITRFTFKFEKITSDELRIRYLITSSNGTVLEDTRSLSDDNTYVIKGDYFSKDLVSYASNFTGKNSECGNHGTVFIRIKNSTNTLMSFAYEPDPIFTSDEICPKLAELTFPKETPLMLTKQ